jgi:hypothetical protein
LKLHPVYSTDIRAECLAEAAKPRHDFRSLDTRKSAHAIVAFLDAIEPLPGPEKWVRLNHYQTLSFFAFDPAEASPRSPQVQILCRLRSSEVQYLLPHEHRPWKWAKTYACNIHEAVELVLDAFTRCEWRRENLVIDD